MTYQDLLRRHGGTIAFGFSLALLSAFGQTFFISLFSPDIRAAFGLSNGGFGMIYSAATLASGLLMIWAGGVLDRVSTASYAAVGLMGLGLAAFGLSAAPTVLALGIALFCLRLFGQGMLGHAAVTSAARLPQGIRGRAVSVAALGFSTGEIVFPFVGIAAAGALGWVVTWRSVAGLLLVAAFLVAAALAFARRRRVRAASQVESAGSPAILRRQILGDWRFLIFIPCMVAPTAINTGYFFHQRLLAEKQGWSLELLALSVGVYAVAGVISNMMTGILVDRFGATRLSRVHLIPLGVASLMLLGASRPIEAPIFFALVGLTATAQGVIVPAVLAELFGTEHLGTTRALAVAIMVVGSATTPGLFGLFFDEQVALGSIGVGCALYVLCASIANVPLGRDGARSRFQPVSAAEEIARSKSATASSTALDRTALRPRSP